MQIKFDGQTHCIDANTLINVLTHYQTIVSESNRQLGGGSRQVEMKINAIEQGSFVVDFNLQQSIVAQLFSKDTVEYIAALCTIVGGIYGLYAVLHGKPTNKATANEENDIKTFVNGDKTIISITKNVYNQPLIREAISKSIETANEDASVDGITLKDDNGKDYAHFKRELFKEYIYDDFDKESDIPNERVQDKDVTLVIVGLNFESGSRWHFMYDGFKIQMVVRDDALMKKIDEGERFGKGDAIRVKMRIVQRYNKLYKAYENKSYKIIEFYEHIIPPKTLDAFEGEGNE